MPTQSAPAKKAPTKKVTKPGAKKAAMPKRPPKRADWQTQVYDPEGKWCGFFMDEATAAKWVGKREGYEITDRKPERTVRAGSGEAQDTQKTGPAETDGAQDEE